MELHKKKTIFLEELRKEDSMPIDLKKKFVKQFLAMSDDELAVFFESIQGIKDENDLNKKMLQTQEMKKDSHLDFLQAITEFSINITRNASRNQESSDKSKANALLSKIKSL